MNDKEFEGQQGKEADGAVAKAFTVSSDNEDSYMVWCKATPQVMVDETNRDFHGIFLKSPLFKHIFGPNFKPEKDIDADDVYVMIGVGAEKFKEEIQAVCENSTGLFFQHSEEKGDQFDITRFVPKVVDRTKGSEDEQ
jgi:hypothetical protein